MAKGKERVAKKNAAKSGRSRSTARVRVYLTAAEKWRITLAAYRLGYPSAAEYLKAVGLGASTSRSKTRSKDRVAALP